MRVLSPYEYQCKLAEAPNAQPDTKDYSQYNNWNTVKRIGKIMGHGLAGMAVGGFGTIGAYALYDKYIGKGKDLPGYVLIPASAAVGAMLGPLVSDMQTTQVNEMRNAVEDNKKYRALKRQKQ